jgi:hypothetical protein
MFGVRHLGAALADIVGQTLACPAIESIADALSGVCTVEATNRNGTDHVKMGWTLVPEAHAIPVARLGC